MSQTSKRTNSVSGRNNECCCKSCKERVDDDQTSIECESCLSWFHSECVSLNKGDMKTIKKPGIHWYCPECDNSLFSINSRLEAIEKQVVTLSRDQTDRPSYSDIVQQLNQSIEQNKTLNEQANKQAKDMLEAIEKQVVTLSQDQINKPSYSDMVQQLNQSIEQNKTLNEQANKQAKDMQENVSKQILSIHTEIQAESRAKNLIVFGIKENEGPTGKTVEDIEDILKECGLHCPIEKSQVHRLGSKIITKDRSRPRPVRLLLRSETEKWEVLHRINAQRPTGVFARLDLTKEEQHQDFRLRQELKQRREQDPENKYKISQGKVVKI